mmetsp:Transcript_1467/g.3905  ORF Transcript_1467/g.3905 Transcript_1467/m.3905 type:complete len:241 (+) Transcript_1467:1632-2354(+)
MLTCVWSRRLMQLAMASSPHSPSMGNCVSAMWHRASAYASAFFFCGCARSVSQSVSSRRYALCTQDDSAIFCWMRSYMCFPSASIAASSLADGGRIARTPPPLPPELPPPKKAEPKTPNHPCCCACCAANCGMSSSSTSSSSSSAAPSGGRRSGGMAASGRSGRLRLGFGGRSRLGLRGSGAGVAGPGWGREGALRRGPWWVRGGGGRLDEGRLQRLKNPALRRSPGLRPWLRLRLGLSA